MNSEYIGEHGGGKDIIIFIQVYNFTLPYMGEKNLKDLLN